MGFIPLFAGAKVMIYLLTIVVFSFFLSETEFLVPEITKSLAQTSKSGLNFLVRSTDCS